MEYIATNAGLLRDVLTGASVACATDKALPAFNAVKINVATNDGTTALEFVASDRYRLIVGGIAGNLAEFSPEFDALIPLDTVKSWLKALGAVSAKDRATTPARLEYDGAGITLHVAGQTITAPMPLSVDQFPKYRQLLARPHGTPDGVTEIGLNQDLLASVAKVPCAKGESVKLEFTTNNRPVFITIPHDFIKWEFLLMPVRLSDKYNR